jgi:hypothetical protein
MSVRTRLANLEKQRAGSTQFCRMCPPFIFNAASYPNSSPEPQFCGRCGRPRRLIRKVIVVAREQEA